MSAEITEHVGIETAEAADDNPSRMLHLICPWCYPEIPPVGTPTVRWCGQVVTIKDDGILDVPTSEVPAEACVICAELPTCSTCGARKFLGGILRPHGGPS